MQPYETLKNLRDPKLLIDSVSLSQSFKIFPSEKEEHFSQ